MNVFLTGATGFIGSRIVSELLTSGHSVLGLTRSAAGESALIAAGAQAHRGDIEDLESLRAGAARADAVIHTAFDHDFSNYVANCEKDGRVIMALGGALTGSSKPLVITSGTAMGSRGPGYLATEDAFDPHHSSPRAASELAGATLTEAGVNVSVMRLPQVHDPVKQGLISPLIELAREKGVSAYVEEGLNRWSAAHVTDVAQLYCLALDAAAGPARYNAVAEEGVAMRDIAQAIGEGLGVPVVSLSPEQAADHFGWLMLFIGADLSASSAWTRERLGWRPTGPDLIADLRAMDFSAPA